MEMSAKSRRSVGRLWKGSFSFILVLWPMMFGALFAALSTAAGRIDLVLIVQDVDGNSIPKFEAMIHTHHRGYIRWQPGRDGRIHFGTGDVQSLSLRDDPLFQVIVRAPGLAPAILNLENTGMRMEETVVLTPGRLVELSVRTADGQTAVVALFAGKGCLSGILGHVVRPVQDADGEAQRRDREASWRLGRPR